MLQFEYSIAYLLLCAALASAYAFILYFWGKSDFSKTQNWFFGGLRFTAAFLIAFFLLKPLLNYSTNESERPILVVGLDNSLSIVQGEDSTFYKSEFPSKLKSLMSQWEDKFDVKAMLIGETTSDWEEGPDFGSKQTDLGGFFETINDDYAYNNVGAVVLASDGLYNKGKHPEYVENETRAPLFTIGLGDSSAQKDQWIERVRSNKLAFYGNDFPIEVSVRGELLKGNSAKLQLYGFNRLLETKEISHTSRSSFIKEKFMIKAEKDGNQAFRVVLSEIEGEVSNRNNNEVIYLDIIDSRQKVLILSSVTNPDIAAIRSSVENNENYEVEFVPHRNAEKLSIQEVENKYSLVILNQIPHKGQRANGTYQAVIDSKLPRWYILGENSDINAFNRTQSGVRITAHNNRFNEVQGKLNQDFTSFVVDQKDWGVVQEAPPLQAPFGQYIVQNQDVLYHQRIGAVSTDYPLWSMGMVSGKKVGVLTAQGIWRWKLFEANSINRSSALNDLVDRTVNFLATRESKSRFKLATSKRIQENTPMEFLGEVYNASYESDKAATISIEIINDDGKIYEYQMKGNNNGFELNTGIWEPGIYSYRAKAVSGGQSFSKEGEIVVTPVSVEYSNHRADYGLLARLASSRGGAFYSQDELDRLSNDITNLSAPSVIHTETKYEDLISLKWIFFLILSLLGLEWFLRKREGTI